MGVVVDEGVWPEEREVVGVVVAGGLTVVVVVSATAGKPAEAWEDMGVGRGAM